MKSSVRHGGAQRSFLGYGMNTGPGHCLRQNFLKPGPEGGRKWEFGGMERRICIDRGAEPLGEQDQINC